MIKVLNKLDIGGSFLTTIKTIHDKLTAIIILKWGKAKSISKFILIELIQSLFPQIKLLTRALDKRKIQSLQIEKEGVKLWLFVDYLILPIENLNN